MDNSVQTLGPGPFVSPYPDVGYLGNWSVSSSKFGFGAECLQDDDPTTFWHSDGPQPHFITVQFSRKVAIQKLALLLNHTLDDSYTPQTLSLRAGTGMNDLQEVRTVTLEKPTGWMLFDVSLEPDEDGDGFKPLHAYVIQMVVAENHSKGKDTHVRGMRILSPLESDQSRGDDPFPFISPHFKMYECVR